MLYLVHQEVGRGETEGRMLRTRPKRPKERQVHCSITLMKHQQWNPRGEKSWGKVVQVHLQGTLSLCNMNVSKCLISQGISYKISLKLLKLLTFSVLGFHRIIRWSSVCLWFKLAGDFGWKFDASWSRGNSKWSLID